MASANFADDQIAEAIDDADLARKHERGGVELGEDGGAVDAGAGTETLAGIDGGFGRSSFRGTPCCVPRRASSSGRRAATRAARGVGKTPARIDPQA